MTSDDDVGGYPEEFIEPLHPRYECPICFLALREPLQLPCGHRFCEICFSKIPERQNASKQCPLDRNVVPPGTAFKDVGCQREILDLRVRCSNNTRNCEWTGELREVKNHKNVCDFEDVECTNEGCTDVVQRQTLEDHVRRLCSHRLVQCPHCLTDCTPNELDEHIEEKCTRYPVQCLNNCTLEVPREDEYEICEFSVVLHIYYVKKCLDCIIKGHNYIFEISIKPWIYKMKAHLLECPRSVVHCEYVNIGCTHKCPRAELSNHLDTYLRPHLNYAVEKIVFLETEMEKQQHGFFEKLEIQNKEIQQLEDRLQVQEDEFKVKFQQQEIQLKQILEELKKREANTDFTIKQ